MKIPIKVISTDLDWYALSNGGYQGTVVVGRVDDIARRMLECSDYRVKMDVGYVQKSRFKHLLDPAHLRMIPLCLTHGTIIQDRDRTLSFFYDDQHVYGRIFHLAIKTTGRRHELWVRTFFAVSNSDYNRRRKRGIVIRVQR